MCTRTHMHTCRRCRERESARGGYKQHLRRDIEEDKEGRGQRELLLHK